jgi:SAM-dependent methyltransferase
VPSARRPSGLPTDQEPFLLRAMPAGLLLDLDTMSLVYNREHKILPYGSPLRELPESEPFDFRYFPCFCGCEEEVLVSNTTRHRTNLSIVQCADCGTLRINPYLSDSSIDRYYAEIYRNVKHSERSPEDTFVVQERYSADGYRLITQHIPRDARILDYGCAAGGRMSPFLENGYDVNGFDLNEKFLTHAVTRGIKRFVPSEKYDLIFLSHVVEHINEPVDFLRNIVAENLSPDGHIYITVPLIDHQGGEARHDNLLAEIHLAHKFYLTTASIRHLAHLAGLKVVALEGDRYLFNRQQSPQTGQSREEMVGVSNAVLNGAARQLMLYRTKWLVANLPRLLINRMIRRTSNSAVPAEKTKSSGE